VGLKKPYCLGQKEEQRNFNWAMQVKEKVRILGASGGLQEGQQGEKTGPGRWA